MREGAKGSTNSSFVIDTYAWVEYLLGSKAGERARDYIDGGGGLTPSVVLLELRKWCLKEIEAGRRSEREMRSFLAFAESKTTVIPLDGALAAKAGQTDFLMKKRIRGWPMADSIILATASAKACDVVTGDTHFKGLDETIFIG